MPGTPIKISDIIDPNLKTTAKELGDTLRGVGGDVDKLKEMFEQLAKSIRDNADPMTKTAQGLSELEKRIGTLENAMKAIETAQKANTDAMNSVNKTMTTLQQKATDVVNAMGRVGQATRQAQSATSKMTAMTDREAQALKNLSNFMQTYKGDVQQLSSVAVLAAQQAQSQTSTYGYMKAILKELKAAMDSLTESQRSNLTGNNDLLGAIRAMEAALKSEKQTEEESNRVKMESSKLTQVEYEQLEKLAAAVAQAGTNVAALNSIGQTAIAISKSQSSSYNYMNAVLSLLKNAMNGLTEAQRNTMTSGNDLITGIRSLESALKTEKQTTEEANRAKREYKKLNDTEYQSVVQLKQAIAAGGQTRMEAVSKIQVETQSYNELQQTYNTLKDALNALTMAERDNSAEGVILTAKAKEIADAMNLAQQATGQYALNVGNYKSAFDSLGFSVQQVLREAPSTLAAGRIDQFFLAISNNIPLVVDQITLFNRRAKEAAVKAAEVNAVIQKYETILSTMSDTDAGYDQLLEKVEQLKKSHADLEKQTTSAGKAMLRSVFSWQSAILVVLMLLPKLVKLLKEVVEKARESAKGIREMKNEVSVMAAEARLLYTVAKKTRDESVELELIVSRLKSIEQGTEEWRKGILAVNKITNANLSTTTSQIGEVEAVTKAYIKQAEQLAINQELTAMIAKSEANLRLRQIAYNPDTYGTARKVLELESGSKEEKEFNKLFMNRNQAIRDLGKEYRSTYTVDGKTYKTEETEEQFKSRMQRAYDNAETAYRNFINNRLEIQSEDAIKALRSKYALEFGDIEGAGSGSKGKQVTPETMTDRYWEMEQALIDAMEEGLEKELALEELGNRMALAENEKSYEEEMAALKHNVENGFITKKEYEERVNNSKMYYDNIRQALEIQHNNKMQEIQKKYADKEYDERVKSEKEQIKLAKHNVKMEQEVLKKRVRTLTDEDTKNRQILGNISKLSNAIEEEKLKMVNYTKEAAEESQAAIDEWIKKIEELRSKMDFSKRLSGYSNISDLLKQNVDFGGDFKKGILTSMLGPDFVGAMTGDQIDSNFEMWLDSAYDSLKTWYDNTMGYIGDIIDAYYDLAQAKADAAAEETESARNEYEAQQALLEAGYANNMEVAKQEYLEKKKLQEQADKEAKKAQQMQLSLDTAQQASSMATAIANLYKMYSALPGGVALATVLTAAMLGTFVAAKIKAHQVAQYGEGTAELIEGGSHASGNDVSLAYDKKGRERRVEGGEVFGVIRKKSVRRYGKDTVLGIINSLNDGTYERDSVRMVERNKEIAIGAQSWRRSVDLSKIERSLTSIDRNGKGSSYVDSEGNYVEVRSNGKITHIKR